MKSVKSVFAVLMSALAFVSVSASAAVPAAVGTALTTLETDGTAIADLVWPILISFAGIAILMKLFKRFANKM